MNPVSVFFAAFFSLFALPLWVYGIVIPSLLVFGRWAAWLFEDDTPIKTSFLVAAITLLAGAVGIAFLWAIFQPVKYGYGG